MESLAETLQGAFASLVNIMRGRRGIFSQLGVLTLDRARLSLCDAEDVSLFDLPVSSVQARLQRRPLAVHQIFFQVHAGDRWWYLAAHVPTKYERTSTRELRARHDARQLAPRPTGMDDATYARLTKNPTSHQVLWVACWMEALNRAGAQSPG